MCMTSGDGEIVRYGCEITDLRGEFSFHLLAFVIVFLYTVIDRLSSNKPNNDINKYPVGTPTLNHRWINVKQIRRIYVDFRV